MRQHEHYKELIWALAKTDFKLRYQSSILGYVWAILQPLLIFSIMNFVFSSVFKRGAGSEYYSLQLFIGIILFNFFSEGTTAGMASLLSKASLVTKIYIPRWTIILSSTINSAMVFLTTLLVLLVFFVWYRFLPSFESILFFLLYILMTYVIILAFSFFTAPLYVRFRDLLMIWQVITRALLYATPIIYSLQMMPEYVQRVLLINPMAFIIHFSKESMINNHFADVWQNLVFCGVMFLIFFLSIWSYKKLSVRVAENI